MALLELLIRISMIITAMAALNEDWIAEIQTAVNYNLSDNVKPTHYDIQLILPVEEAVYSGESMISIEIYEQTRHIELHSVNLVVTKVVLINKNLRIFKKNIEKSGDKPIKYFYYHQTNIFSMYFGNKILPGNYTLSMKFLGQATKNTEGLFRTSYKNKKGNTIWLFATYLQTTGARYLFPCWDEPKLKAEFTISVKHPKKYKALSNMPIQNVHNVENNMVWTYFNTTPSISPYLIAIAIIDFKDDVSLNNDIINNILFNELNIKVWFRKKIHYNSTAYNIFHYSAEFMNFWLMYSFKLIPKVDYVAIPDFPEKAVATWGLVFYREADIFYEPDNTMSELNMASLIAYNMIVESLSGLPSWLKEGFATFIDAVICDYFSSYHKMDFFVVQRQHESLRFNFHLNKNLSQINKLDINLFPGFLRYNKAFSILRMLHYLVTDHVFPLGMKQYLKKTLILYSSDSISQSKIFWRSMQHALDELHPDNNVILIRKMDGWTKQKSYPILKLKRENGYTSILLENFDSIDGELWIPMTYTTQNNPDFSKTSFRDVKWLKFTKEELFAIDVSKFFLEDGWVIINLQQAGYYRVNYDTENWKKIAKYLNDMEYTDIHILNRAQIIDDAYHFLTTGQINSSLFWEITNYLSRETNFIAWYPMIKAFEYMSSVFPLSDIGAYDIKEKMQKMLNGVLQKIPYEKLNMLTYIAQEITKWTCILGDFDCKKLATSNLEQYLSNRIRNKFLPREEWTYCNGLAMSNNILWTNVFDIYQEEFDNKYLRFLACSENIAMIKKFIMLVAVENSNKTIKHKDCMSSLHFIIVKHAKNSIILDYIFANYNKIIPRQATVAILIDIINHVYSTEQFYKIRQFVKDYSKELILNVERKIEIRLSEIKNQMDYLEILTK